MGKKKKKIYAGVVKRDRWGRIIGIERYTGKPRVVETRGRGEVVARQAAGILEKIGHNLAETERKNRGRKTPKFDWDY